MAFRCDGTICAVLGASVFDGILVDIRVTAALTAKAGVLLIFSLPESYSSSRSLGLCFCRWPGSQRFRDRALMFAFGPECLIYHASSLSRTVGLGQNQVSACSNWNRPGFVNRRQRELRDASGHSNRRRQRY
jgi:hypothetical protein